MTVMIHAINNVPGAIEKGVITITSDGKNFSAFFIYPAFERRDDHTHPGGVWSSSLVPGPRTLTNGGLCNIVLLS
jgi:hypothetical protein